MKHDPHLIVFVETELDKVIAGAERAQRFAPVLVNLIVILGCRCTQFVNSFLGSVGQSAVAGAGAQWNAPLNAVSQLIQIVRQIFGEEFRSHGHHAAAHVDAHRRRDDCPFGGDDGTDSCALAEMAIRHHRHVTENEGHFRDILELRLRLRLDRFRRKKRDDLVVYLIHAPQKTTKISKTPAYPFTDYEDRFLESVQSADWSDRRINIIPIGNKLS